MSNEKELKQFDDYDYDELFKNEYPDVDVTSFGASSRKYWTLNYRKLSDDPLETINRGRFMLDNYDGDPEYIDRRFTKVMDKIFDKAFKQVKEMQIKINKLENNLNNLKFDEKYLENIYLNRKNENDDYERRDLSYELEEQPPSDNPIENLHRIKFMIHHSTREMGYLSIEVEELSLKLIETSIKKIEEIVDQK